MLQLRPMSTMKLAQVLTFFLFVIRNESVEYAIDDEQMRNVCQLALALIKRYECKKGEKRRPHGFICEKNYLKSILDDPLLKLLVVKCL
jgi:hypothetical protein